MLETIFRSIFGKKLIELEELRQKFSDGIISAQREKEFALRNNVVFVEPENINSEKFAGEITAIWKSNQFRFLLHLTRNEFVAELVKGGDVASKNVPGMLKGLDALAMKMQEISDLARKENEEI